MDVTPNNPNRVAAVLRQHRIRYRVLEQALGLSRQTLWRAFNPSQEPVVMAKYTALAIRAEVERRLVAAGWQGSHEDLWDGLPHMLAAVPAEHAAEEAA